MNTKYISSSVLKISIFSTHKMTCICYLPKKVNFPFILYLLEDLQLINLKSCFKANHNNINEDKGVFVIEYLDQSKVIWT